VQTEPDCWRPAKLLADGGYLYLLDGHPFFVVWDEERLPELAIKSPYFVKRPDRDEWIGGYASEPKQAVNCSWMYTMGEIVTALSQAGLRVEWLHELDWLYYPLSADEQEKDERGRWVHPEHRQKRPYTFALKATIP
jgi:hypothetical protein